jgi:ketosteroid isomerase-like protein
MTTTPITTSVQEENVERVRKGYEAFGAGDIATLTELFHPDAVWNAPERGVLAGTYHGRDTIFGFFGQLQQESKGTFRAIPVALAATGAQVFVQHRTSAERNGRTLRSEAVLVYTIEGSVIREVREYPADHTVEAAFWA